MGVSERLLGFFAGLAGPPKAVASNGQAASWVVRMQREDNLWLRAGSLEAQGQLAEARHLYLKDASSQAALGVEVRAALSYIAAARIAVRLEIPSQAQWEFEQAADLFRRHAEGAARWSLREILWAYDRAATLYEAAGLPGAAATMQIRAAAIGAHLFLPVDGAGAVGPAAARRHPKVRIGGSAQ